MGQAVGGTRRVTQRSWGPQVRAFLDALGTKANAKQKGNQWEARCPAHDDNRASLSIGEGKDGRVLLRCFAGCDAGAIVGAVGLKLSDLFPPKEPKTSVEFHHGPSPYRPARPVLVKTYDYVDENGVLLSQTCRFEPGEDGQRKSFKQRRPDGNGGWIYKRALDGVRLVPYRLPEIIEAVAAERTIHVAEGEKDVDALWALGMPATTNPMGALKWRTEFCEHLRGASSVVIFPDNDEKGEQHAQMVAESLHAVGVPVRICRLPNLPPKGDVSDWLAQGGTPDELHRLMDAAPSFPDAEPVLDDDGAPLPTAICALNAPPAEPVRWLIEDLWTEADIGLFVGDGGVLKSSVALHIGLAVAYGAKAFGKFQAEQRAVLIVSAEDSAGVLHSRMDAICRGHGWPREQVLANVYYHAMDGASLSSAAWVKQLRREVERHNIGLVILDPLAELLDGDENSASDSRLVIQAARSLTIPSRAAVIIVHHVGKAGKPGEKRRIDRVRGSSAFYNAARCAYFLDKPSATEDDIAVECLKLSRAEKPEPFVVRPIIDVEPENRAMWTLARFEYRTANLAALDRAAAFVIEQLSDGTRLSTSGLKDAAKGTGISAVDLSKALKSLETRKRIDFEEGEKNAKLWGLVCLPEKSRQPRQPEKHPEMWLPGNQDDVSATASDPQRACSPPLGEQAREPDIPDVAVNLGNQRGAA